MKGPQSMMSSAVFLLSVCLQFQIWVTRSGGRPLRRKLGPQRDGDLGFSLGLSAAAEKARTPASRCFGLPAGVAGRWGGSLNPSETAISASRWGP